MAERFPAFIVRETTEGRFESGVEIRDRADLPDGELLIRVRYSSLNYKDALSATGNRGVTRSFPHTPGIDAAGEVVESRSGRFRAGDGVIVSGFDFGTSHPGGYGRFIRVPAAWTVPLPAGLSARESMIYGSAGFTAAICVERLAAAGVDPSAGEILVTGATGGVGSVSVALLAGRGYRPVAATGKTQEHGFLRDLGAERVIPREEADDRSGKPLLPRRWAGVVDTVGGNILATAVRSVTEGGCVTCCGNASSPDLPLTVFPFILRGVSLLGIDASRIEADERSRIWTRLAGEWRIPDLDRLVAEEVGLDGLKEQIGRILGGGIRGRVLVRLD